MTAQEAVTKNTVVLCLTKFEGFRKEFIGIIIKDF